MLISRRLFSRSLLAAGASLALPASLRGATDSGKLVLSAPLTHSDWMLKPGMQMGMPGVKHMLDLCKASGLSHIYWRVFDAGVATYKSKLVRPGDKPEHYNYFNPETPEDRAARDRLTPGLTEERSAEILRQLSAIDYSAFDSLAAAIEYGHSIGLKIHAWMTINEDDHGWGWPSEFTKAHPEFRWARRDGTRYRSQLSFAFPEVRDYKLALVDEILSNYDVDGIFLDWIRTGDIRDNPQTTPEGVADSGYETPNLERFKQQFGIDAHDVAIDDERWLRVRAEPQTIFMRSVRQRVSQDPRPVPISVMVGHPWHYRGTLDPIAGNLKGLLLDVGTWAKEGLMDAAVAAGYYRPGGDAEKAFAALKDETSAAVDLWTYAWIPNTPAELARDAEIAKKVAAGRILFWEADYLQDRTPAVRAAMKQSAR